MNTKQSINKQFSKEHLSAVLEAMIRVKGGEIGDYGRGICCNTQMLMPLRERGSYIIIDAFSPLWSKYSGSLAYPVPVITLGFTPRQEYRHSLDKWAGEYGQLRYELLDFLIEELTKAVEEYDNEY